MATLAVFESCCKKGTVSLQPSSICYNRIPIFDRVVVPTLTQHCATVYIVRPPPGSPSAIYEHNYIFQLQGTVYHYQGPLETGPEVPSYSQLFFLESNDATVIREEKKFRHGFKGNSASISRPLLRTENLYSKIYHRAHDILNRNSDLSCLRLNPQLRLIPNKNEDPRRYNLPTVNSELAVLIPDIPGEYGSPFPQLPRHPSLSAFRSRLYGKWRSFFDPDHALYLLLHYVLFYPAGGRGYHQGLSLNSGANLTARVFYRFHLHTRKNPFQSLHRADLSSNSLLSMPRRRPKIRI